MSIIHVFTLTRYPFRNNKATFTKDDEFILKIALLLNGVVARKLNN